ncbi:MAG TPA: RNA-binding cell elongation regulator Jag/EloR [Acidimicrobiales bacterium]|nr:RNA-binding cell elongation regulator Jag/EloR [Acidimicrobiales bacterium]
MTGKTVEEATERALDQLGVAEGDAEVIVVTEAKTGLFGRVREEARVRARVRPVGARPKRERTRRNTRSAGRQGGGQRTSTGGSGSASSSGGSVSRGSGSGSGGRAATGGGANGGGGGSASGGGEARTAGAGSGTSRSARRRRNRSKATVVAEGSVEASQNGSSPRSSARPPRQADQGDNEVKETEDMAEGMTLEEQGEVGRAFLAGLLSEYGMEASVECRLLDEDTVEIAATGDDLGILVGPRGSTLVAVQDLTRAVVQRQCPSRTDRILVDVAGYREKRSAALKRFSTQIAEEVLSSGQEKALEAMSPADRKAVHDAINEMSGVVTRSEGEDPNRYIVIAPAG